MDQIVRPSQVIRRAQVARTAQVARAAQNKYESLNATFQQLAVRLTIQFLILMCSTMVVLMLSNLARNYGVKG